MQSFMKFGQFMSYYKRKELSKNYAKTSSRLFCVCKELNTFSNGK